MSRQDKETDSDFPAGVALVVGGSGGLGAAIARGMAAAGSAVVLTWRNTPAPAEALAADLRAGGADATATGLDLADAEATAATLERIGERHGPLHSVICAAGAAIDQPRISGLDPATFRKVIDDDLNGFFHLVNAVLPALRRSRGSLTAVTSAGLHRWPPGDALSVVPKAGIESLVKGLAREEGRYGIRANCVAPGVIEAGMFLRLRQGDLDEEWQKAALRNTPLRRFGQAREIADAVVFLASRRAAYITGQTLILDGGYHL